MTGLKGDCLPSTTLPQLPRNQEKIDARLDQLEARCEITESKGVPTRYAVRTRSRGPTPCSTPHFGARPTLEVDGYALGFSGDEDVHDDNEENDDCTILKRREVVKGAAT